MPGTCMWTRFPDTEASRFSLQATFLLSSRTSRWQQQEPWIALVAQGIERLPPEQKVVGSNPIEGTDETPAAWKSCGGFCVPFARTYTLRPCLGRRYGTDGTPGQPCPWGFRLQSSA